MEMEMEMEMEMKMKINEKMKRILSYATYRD